MNIYPLQAPYENLHKSPSSISDALDSKTWILIPIFIYFKTPLQWKNGTIHLHYMTREAIRCKLRQQYVGDQNGEEWGRKWWHHWSSSTKILGEANPWMRGWARSTTHNGPHWLLPLMEVNVRSPIFWQLHFAHERVVGTTSYPQRVEVAPYKPKMLFFNKKKPKKTMCV